MMKNKFEINKNIGETPLEALERFRLSHPELKKEPMTYAGRLDPMAEGALLILVGDECKHKEKYIGLDKEYEIEIVFGFGTDTYDALGLVDNEVTKSAKKEENYFNGLEIDLLKYTGTFKQKYPPYSSKTVDGVQLHKLARNNELPEEMPEKEVKIYSIDVLNCSAIKSSELKNRIIHNIDQVKGDFRQEEIKARWNEVLDKNGRDSNDRKNNNDTKDYKNSNSELDYSKTYEILKLRVKCSSGTYMRSLANQMGEDLETKAFALSIKRTRFL